MKNETLALLVSFVAMSFVVISYFVQSKSLYLLFQALGIVFLIASYFFTAAYFAMIGLAVGLVRALVFFAYEKRERRAPLWWAFVISGMTIAAYFIVNFAVLKTARPLDVLCLIALVMYAFIFRIRNLKIVRFTMLAPTGLSILYNIFSGAAVFVVLSYSFELAANIASIFKYHFFEEKKETQSVSKEYTYEKR